MSDVPPGFSRLLRLQPILALGTGYLCLFLFRKGYEHAPVAIVFFAFAFFSIVFRLYLAGNRRSQLDVVWDMAFIYAINDMLFFVVPFYIESMTLFSRNVIFAPIFIGLLVVTNWFHLYRRLVLSNPLGSAVFYSLVFFSALNFLFPAAFGMRNIWSLLLSGAVASLTAVLYIYPHSFLLKTRRNTVIFISGVVLLYAGLWFGRSIIPPAPLRLMDATACRNVAEFTPVEPFKSAAFSGEEIFFFTRIFAPRGLSEKINHVWYHNGRRLFTVKLDEIQGGAKDGFATWSSHAAKEGPGRYSVEVWTAGGQILGEMDCFIKNKIDVKADEKSLDASGGGDVPEKTL
jgi:hypothetical protein